MIRPAVSVYFLGQRMKWRQEVASSHSEVSGDALQITGN